MASDKLVGGGGGGKYQKKSVSALITDRDQYMY